MAWNFAGKQPELSGLAESEKKSALVSYERKREKAVKELGLDLDDPAVELALPKDTILDDEAFEKKTETLKTIAERIRKEPAEDDKDKGDDKGEIDKWKGFGGVHSETDNPPTDGLSDQEKQWDAAKKEYTKDRDVRHLVGKVFGKLKQVTVHRTRGGSTFYDIEEVR